MKRMISMCLSLFGIFLFGLSLETGFANDDMLKVFSVEKGVYIMSEKVVKTETEWRQQLSEEQFHILRERGTERAYSGKYHDSHGEGIYRCAGCGLDLFSSETKYDSQSGWPSFYTPIAPENIAYAEDRSLFMTRTEILCPRCSGHLGHVFPDGPKPTGQRFCMNSAALTFVVNKW